MNEEFCLPKSVVSLRLYGSFCRGDCDELSDVDVLAVYEEPPTKSVREVVRRQLSSAFDRKVDLAEYSRPRIREFFTQGHLFAWHLHAESQSLVPGKDLFFETLGSPAPYREAYADSVGFVNLLRSCSHELPSSGVSLVYEAGLAYLASRNVAICVSYGLNERPDFSRCAIYNTCEQLDIQLDVERLDYERLIRCRFASIRGQPSEKLSVSWVAGVCKSLELVSQKLVERTFGGL